MQQDVDPQKLVDGKLARYHKIVGSPLIKACSPALRGWSTSLPLAASLVADAECGSAGKDMGSCAGHAETLFGFKGSIAATRCDNSQPQHPLLECRCSLFKAAV
jgi:hypothetical protein